MIKRLFLSEHKLYAFNAWCILVLLTTKACLAAERYNIYREKMSNDRFRIPGAICKDQKCDSFYAKNTDKACECLCDLNDGKRSTLALSNRTWSCAYDRELRLREGCTMLFVTEQLDSPLAVISLNIQQHLMVSKWPVQYCTMDPLNANYQDCDGKWIPIQNADQKFSFRGAVWLQIRTDTISEDFSYLNGKLIKLGFNCKTWTTETLTKECMLFKFTGNVSCPAPTKPNPSTRPITTDLSPKPTSVSARTKSETTTLVKTMRTHDTTKSASETMRSTLSTLKTMTRSTARGTRRLTRVHSSKKVAETRTITLSPTTQERVSTSVLHNVTTGEKDRGQNEGNSESIFTIIASTIAAVLVVIATLTAALVIVRRRKQESGSAKTIKSPFRLSLKVERGKSNESLISVQSAASAANNEVFLEPGDSEYQRKQDIQSDSDKNKNYEKSCEPNEMKTEELGSPSSGYESLRSYHSYECLTNQNTNIFSGEYSYAKYDGPMNDKSPVYYVLEGPNPNSSGANKEYLSETKSRKTSHTYDNVERLDAFDEVYATIDETDLNSLNVTSPQSPVYVELDSSLTEEIEI